MKQRDFHLRLELSDGANLRRLKAFIRQIDPGYRPMPKLKARANLRAMLRQVK